MVKKLAWSFATAFLFAACGGTSTTIGDGGGGGDGSNGGDGSMSSEGGSDAGGDAPLGNCNAPAIDLTFTGCPATPTCGMSIVDGNYYYTTGCIPDPWAQAKQTCQALTVSNEKGSVKACVSFLAGIVSRNVSSSYSATLHIPTACLLGGNCMMAEAALKPYFTTTTCATAVAGCDCMVGSTYVGTGATTYTTMNNQVVTGQNNVYNYCANGNMLGLSWASGPNREPGVYTLQKQ